MKTLTIVYLAGSIVIFADLPLFFLFAIVAVGIMLEAGKIEKKIYTIMANIFLNAIVGWATSFGVKHFVPNWFEGDVRIFSMLMTTLFAYVSILYFYKNETIQKLLEKWFNKKVDNDNSSNN